MEAAADGQSEEQVLWGRALSAPSDCGRKLALSFTVGGDREAAYSLSRVWHSPHLSYEQRIKQHMIQPGCKQAPTRQRLPNSLFFWDSYWFLLMQTGMGSTCPTGRAAGHNGYPYLCPDPHHLQPHFVAHFCSPGPHSSPEDPHSW